MMHDEFEDDSMENLDDGSIDEDPNSPESIARGGRWVIGIIVVSLVFWLSLDNCQMRRAIDALTANGQYG
jgi:hypothetical protein